MKEQEKYKQMMNEIHVSEATLRKVMEMDMNKKNLNQKNMMKKMGMTAAALLLCLAATNGVTYAATGQSWIENVVVYINGEAVEKEAVEKIITAEENEDGSVLYIVDSIVDTADDGSSISIVAEDESASDSYRVDTPKDVESLIESGELNTIAGTVIEKDGKQYLEYNSGKVDITKDLADGIAAGTILDAGVVYSYKVTEENGEYDVTIDTQE